jgi:hypothetical protein
MVIGRLLCRLGFHTWDTTVTDGEQYLTCRRCGKYGDAAFRSKIGGWGGSS